LDGGHKSPAVQADAYLLFFQRDIEIDDSRADLDMKG
jgi:hypothetical protein